MPDPKASDIVVIERASAALGAPVDPRLEAATAAAIVDKRPPNTVRAYAADWARFEAWCAFHALPACPADEKTICTHLMSLQAEGLKHSTIARAWTSIRVMHRDRRCELPTMRAVGNVLQEIHDRQVNAGVRVDQKRPLLIDVVRIASSGDSIVDVRDRALLLVGFAAALRRSELVALDVADLEWVNDEVIVTVRRGKTDQKGVGREIGLSGGVGRALRAWLSRASITAGPVFRPVTPGGKLRNTRLSDIAVSRAVKKAAAARGLDPRLYGGHSLRAGLVTSAARENIELHEIMATTGHKSEAIAREYVRHATVLEHSVSRKLGL